MRETNSTKPSAWLVLILLVTADAQANTADEARDWYVSQYSPHFTSIESVEAVRVEYLKEIYTTPWRSHPPSADSRLIPNTVESWSGYKDRLHSRGWLSGTLKSVDASRLNNTTAVIKARWIHRYRPESGVPTTELCDWYIASKESDGWKITSHAPVACD